MKRYLKKILVKLNLTLPSPVELGKSKVNALPSRFFSNKSGEYTWEDYYTEMKKQYPVRYFLSETLVDWFTYNPIRKFFTELWYWIRCHTYNRYHSLDLRQPKTDTEDDYRWGYIDSDRQMLFACFNILVAHVETRAKNSFSYKATPESIASLRALAATEPYADSIISQADHLEEMYNLHKYWTVDRKESLKKIDSLYEEADLLIRDFRGREEYLKFKSSEAATKYNAKLEECYNARYAFDTEETEMLIRLMKIRGGLWT